MSAMSDAFLVYAFVCTMFVYLHLYWKYNPFYRLVEAIGIGSTMGNFIVQAYKNITDNAIGPLLEGEVLYIVPIALGLLVFGQLTKRYMWLARFGIATIIGVAVGVNVYGTAGSDIISNLGSIVSMNFATTDGLQMFSNIVSVVFFLSTISYFIFTREQTGGYLGIWGKFTKIGRYAMMVCFGASFGGIIWFRQSLFQDRIVYILETLGLM